MDTDLNVDAGLRAEFIDESLDLLSGLEHLFIQLEQRPDDLDTVQAIFRPVHSIKGNSSFFNFPAVKNLAHEMETLLDLVRKKVLGVSRPMIDALLEGTDALRHMLERGRNDAPEIEDPAAFEALLERVKSVVKSDVTLASLAQSLLPRLKNLQASHGAELPDLHARLEEIIQELQRHAGVPPADGVPAATGQPAALRRIHELLDTPLTAALPDADAVAVGQALEALLEQAADDATRAAIADALDMYTTFMATAGFDALLQELVLERVAQGVFRAAPAGATGPVAPAPAEAAAPAAAEPAAAKAVAEKREEPGKTMRVSEQHIDTFLAYVGELLVVGDMFSHLASRMGKNPELRALQADFRRTNQTFESLSSQLQKSIMSIRLVSVKGLLQRVPRIARDVAARGEKEIDIVIEGDHIEVDKSLVDLLDAPLTHMVRNAADHGIEPAQLRRAAGKPAAGRIRVCLSEEGGFLSLLIEDDGAGLDYEAIQRKAIALGLVPEGRRLSEQDVVDFLFCSGVSTAKEVTDISGRGVGMDVVKGMVEEAGGHIQVNSVRGRGTRFEISVPKSVTTQIVPGFLVEAAGQRFVFPMAKVLETARVEHRDVYTVADKGRCFQHHGRVLTLFRMHDVLDLGNPSHPSREFDLVVVLSTRQGAYAMVVDNVLGVQKVVLRRIQGLPFMIDSIAGGALMGDGTVALILDVDRLQRECLTV